MFEKIKDLHSLALCLKIFYEIRTWIYLGGADVETQELKYLIYFKLKQCKNRMMLKASVGCSVAILDTGCWTKQRVKLYVLLLV